MSTNHATAATRQRPTIPARASAAVRASAAATATAAARVRPAVAEPSRVSHLEVVSTRSQRRDRPRAVYAIVVISALLAIVVAQLLLSIGLSQGAYQLSSLRTKQTDLQRASQAVSDDLNRLVSPQNLASNANALGMVSNSNPAYLRLSDGAVLGAPIAADKAAGTVTGGAGNLVPNSLLNGVPLVTAESPVGGQAGNSAGAGAPAATEQPPSVPLEGALPTPVTH